MAKEKTFTITGPWSHHTLAVTTDYGPGNHNVTQDIFEAWEARNGTSTVEADAPGDPVALQGE